MPADQPDLLAVVTAALVAHRVEREGPDFDYADASLRGYAQAVVAAVRGLLAAAQAAQAAHDASDLGEGYHQLDLAHGRWYTLDELGARVMVSLQQPYTLLRWKATEGRPDSYAIGVNRGFAEAVEALRDDARYEQWWSALPQDHPDYGYWSQHPRRQFADYLETVGPWEPDEQPEAARDAWHSGRAFFGTAIEDNCPCPKAPCGLVDGAAPLSQRCPEHGLTKTIRQGHLASACPDRPASGGVVEHGHCGNDVYVHEPHQSLVISDDGKAVTKRECGGTGPGRAVRGPLAAEEAAADYISLDDLTDDALLDLNALTPPAEDVCPKSQRVDGPLHSWRFDGDDPRIECAFCGQLRNALSGAVIREGDRG